MLALARRGRAARRLFSHAGAIADGTVVDDGWIVDRRGATSTRLVPLDAIHLLGPHLVDDVMAAATVGAIAGAAPDGDDRRGRRFHGLEHAMELVADVGGVRFVNDSKATNVESALRSIESFDRGLVPIIGGRFKGGDLRLLREPLKERGKAVVAIGEARPLVREALDGAVDVHEAETLGEAVARAFALATAVRRRAAGAGVRQLRHVSGLRGTRAMVQRGSGTDSESAISDRVIGEL